MHVGVRRGSCHRFVGKRHMSLVEDEVMHCIGRLRRRQLTPIVVKPFLCVWRVVCGVCVCGVCCVMCGVWCGVCGVCVCVCVCVCV